VSDTPKTDREYAATSADASSACMQMTGFARTLERQLAAVRAERDAAFAQLDQMRTLPDFEDPDSDGENIFSSVESLVCNLTAERDALRSALAEAAQVAREVERWNEEHAHDAHARRWKARADRWQAAVDGAKTTEKG
jgi:small-conductance mechanosensitive channel